MAISIKGDTTADKNEHQSDKIKKCPKCGYLSKIKIHKDNFSPECPQCGVVYEKYMAYINRIEQKEKEEKEGTYIENSEFQQEEQALEIPCSPKTKIGESRNLLIQVLCRIIRQNKKLNQLLLNCKNFILIKWLVKYKDTIAAIIFKLFIIGCIYWIYRFINIDINLEEGLKLFISPSKLDNREAMTTMLLT